MLSSSKMVCVRMEYVKKQKNCRFVCEYCFGVVSTVCYTCVEPLGIYQMSSIQVEFDTSGVRKSYQIHISNMYEIRIAMHVY